MKKKLLVISIVAICIALVAGGTLAYYTAEDKAHNVITTGEVKIKVLEWANAEKTQEFKNLDNIMPGTAVTKIAEVKNTGKSEAWIRVMVTKTIENKSGVTVDTDKIKLDLNTADWLLGEDGCLYYKKPVKPGEVTAPIFTTVIFEANMGNEFQNSTAHVKVDAQAVQTANNGTTVTEALGWPVWSV